MSSDEQVNQAGIEMPRYRSHKTVRALKIKSIEPDGSAPRGASCSCILTPEEADYAPFRVDEEYCRKHNPQAGGYYVVYADGYKSFSPSKAFVEGYSLIEKSYAAAELAVKRPPVTFEYRGLSYEQASCRAQAICRAAGVTGQTINAAKHLAELHAVMDLARTDQG